MSDEKISIVLPCYNHEQYIGDAIRSILNQTYTNFEAFVFDNGSADNSWDVINSFEDERLIKIKLEKNDLLEVKRQFIEKSTGRYCAILYSDDVWLETKLEKQMQYMKNNNDAKICFTLGKQVDENLNEIDGFVDHTTERNKSPYEWWQAFLMHANHLSCPSMMCEREIYEKYFGKLYPYRQIADMFCWMKILQETNLHVIEEILVLQRIHLNNGIVNESARTPENLRREYYELKNLLFKIIDEMPGEVFVKEFLNKEYNNTYSNLDVLCMKYLFLAKDDSNIYDNHDNAIRFYDKYFDYEENGNIFYQYLAKKYGYSRNDFFEFSGKLSKNGQINSSRMKRWNLLASCEFDGKNIDKPISIYGCGDIGKAFYNRIKRYTKVIQFIDAGVKNKTYDEVPIVKLENATINNEMIVVIIPTYDYDNIVADLKKYHNLDEVEIIKFEDFLNRISI